VHEKGGLWSLQTMQETCLLEMGARKARGIKKTPLITCVDVDHYSLPLLHMMMGQGNKLLDSFLDYVDKFPHLEDTPIELKGIWNNFYHALQKQNDAKETHEVLARQGPSQDTSSSRSKSRHKTRQGQVDATSGTKERGLHKIRTSHLCFRTSYILNL